MYSDKSKKNARIEYLYRTKYLPAYLAFIALYPLGLEDLPGEIWKWVKNYEGLYQISSYGRVKSFPRNGTGKEIKIRKPALSRFGYLQISLSKGNEFKFFKIHRLVAETFIPNPQNKTTVNHKYGMKFDSYFENLEWATPSENQQHAVNTGLAQSGENCSFAKLTKEDVKFIREHYKKRDPEYSQSALARRFHVSRLTIEKVANGKTYKNID